MSALNETEQRIVERPLIRKFGYDELIERCEGIASRKYLCCCRHENQEWESLRWHGKPSDFDKYNKADSEGRGELCLSNYDYAEQRIICAALVNYAKTLAARKKAEEESAASAAADAKKKGRSGRK